MAPPVSDRPADRWPSRPGELEHGLVSRAQLADVAGYAGPHRVAHPFGMNGQLQPVAAERDQDRGLAELHGERQATEPAREPRIEAENLVPDMGARVIPLQDFECPGHDTD